MDRPIIFSAPMVRALLAGRKTQTRRIMKPQPSDYKPGELRHPPKHPLPYFDAYNGGPHWCWWSRDDRQGPDWIRCPYGQAGDKLWVKEACGRRAASFLGIEATNGVESAFYKADHSDVLSPDDFNFCPWWSGPTLSPIHMPRWASRLTLEVTEVRVQRLQEISEEDARAEGSQEPSLVPIIGACWSERDAFAKLWQHIHGEGSWAANPWIWAVSFATLPPYQSAAPEEVSRG